jgi:L-2-hydroxyglutarate oxidase
MVCRVLADLLVKGGAQVLLGTKVIGIRADSVLTDRGDLPFDTLVNCAGLHADRVARLAGVDPQVRIVPFRGEYYELKPERGDAETVTAGDQVKG